MGRITGRLLFCLFFLFFAAPSFALSPIPGSLDSQAVLEEKAQEHVDREALGLPKDSSQDSVSGLEFLHSPQYTGTDETLVRSDEVGSSPQNYTVIWQKTAQLSPQWLSTKTALPQDPTLDREFGTYAYQSFTGREWDGETGLYFYRARYYDPQVGRFTGEDPIWDDPNLYAYVGNNAIRFIDPFGLAWYDFIYGSETLGPYGSSNPADWANVTWHPATWNDIYAIPEQVGGPWPAVMEASTWAAFAPIGGPGGGGGATGARIAVGAWKNIRWFVVKCPKPKPSSIIRTVENLAKTADELISGFLRRSKSYHSGYGSKTYQEILNLAKAGDKKARQMQKLIESGKRLRQK